MSTARRRSAGTTSATPRGASPDYVARLQIMARIATRSCKEIVEIIQDVDRRCEIADGDVTPTLQEMRQAEFTRIYKLAQAGCGIPEAEESPTPTPAETARAFHALLAVASPELQSQAPAPLVARDESADPDVIKAITLWQPWASLLFQAEGKRIETRTWGTNYRGRLAIHSGKRVFKSSRQFDRNFLLALAAAFGVSDVEALKLPSRLPLGVILGEVLLVGCYQIQHVEYVRGGGARLHFTKKTGGGSRVISPAEAQFGNYDENRWAWITTRPEPYAQPIPTRGYQAIWEWRKPA